MDSKVALFRQSQLSNLISTGYFSKCPAQELSLWEQCLPQGIKCFLVSGKTLGNPGAQDSTVCSGESWGTEWTPHTMPSPPPAPVEISTWPQDRDQTKRGGYEESGNPRKEARLRRHLRGSESKAVSHLGSDCSVLSQPSPFPGPGAGDCYMPACQGKNRSLTLVPSSN